ncbi:MAG: translation initiation factor IF-2 [Corallococcus sp.]|nr:translation initiation factor IF-2 [Corallococcus sp.]MCM1359724.1 translation initiation factor IF-2 [Corallococcus sp.]MCM1395433.1 translation initiation factor IF-2 [Corallococcus sp.]
MANTEKQKSFDNIKNIRRNVLDAARELQQQLAAVKSKASSLTAGIRSRAAEFAALEVVEIEETVQAPVSVAEQQQVESAVLPTVDEKTEPVAEQEPEVVADGVKEETPAPAPEKPKQKLAAAAQPKPFTPTVVTTVDKDGVKTKTYTDEKGNVKVRRFLDPNASSSRPQRTSQQTGKGAQGGAGRPQVSRQTSANGAQPARSGVKRGFAPVEVPQNAPQKNFGNKNKTKEHPEEKRLQSKKNLLTRDYSADYDEDRIVRRARTKKSGAGSKIVTQKITNAVVNLQDVPIKMLSEKIGVPVSEIISQLFKEGIMKTINDTVDFDYAAYIASLHDVTLELKMDKTAEEIITGAEEDDGLENDTKRPPVVTVMGHVDHGKTSILDAIRKTNVTGGEAGGITQHIGAYTVTAHGETITFIDTPGHAAFTAMRARGAKITDVAIIVVAADDGVMPQTVEAINHAKAAGVSIIVAINKMDKPNVDTDKIKQQLTEYELLAEEWGGDTIMVPVSAKTGMGLDKLLESVLLVTEIKELKANPKKRASGTVLEAKLDKGRGPVATVLVANGTLSVGDSLIAGSATGKIRAMFDDKGRKVKSAGPSMPVEVLGFSEVPQAGDYMYVADEKLVKKAAEERKNKIKLENARQTPSMNLGDLFGRISEGQLKNLNLIIKTDVQGSLEALKGSLEKISNDEVKVSAIHGGVGGINETDVMLAKASDAIIIGFNVRADSNAKSVAESEGVDIRLYNVIYDAVDDVTAAMKGMLAPKFKETVSGTVEVREVFKITGVGAVAGCYVTNGKVLRNSKVRIFRNDISVYEGNILALKRFKDDVKEVASGYECGISIENYNDIKVGDVFEIYQMEEIAQ